MATVEEAKLALSVAKAIQSDVDAILSKKLYYCVKCKKKTEMQDAQQVTMRNGKPAMRGQCTVCGTTVNAILSTKKAVS